LATAHGICVQLGMNLTDPSLTLSVFVRMLGGSNMLVELLLTIRLGGWFLPQSLAVSWIQPQEPTPASREVMTNYGTVQVCL
jgi:hypothetical protein